MQFAISVPIAVLLFCNTLFGQSATRAIQPQTLQVRGTITDPLEGVIPGVKVTFQNALPLQLSIRYGSRTPLDGT